MRRTLPVPFPLLALLLALAPAGRGLGMDQVRVETKVDAAVAKYGLTGQGVIVALLDRGIDWRSNDFRNADGTTRIAAIFDLTDDAGATAAGNPYGKGTIYTRQQIDQALSAGTNLAIRDAVGHGTTTAGIPTGNGRNSGGKYRGVAPEATIVVVKITSDGAPAHDDQPAEAAFYDPARIPLGIDFVKDQAKALGMPAVMLLNLGSQGGPTDGTSEIARKIDATVGPGVPGLVFVTGPGDDGGIANRAGGTVTAGNTESIRIQKGLAGSLYFDLWYGGADRFDVTIGTPSGTFGPYASPATNSDTTFVSNATLLLYHLGSSKTFFGAQNGKREIYLRLDGPPGVYTVSLRGASVASGRFDATINPSQVWNSANANYLLDHAAPGNIWDGATARNNICPGDYVIRTSWVDVDGVPRSITGQGNPGEIWSGSSAGPTFDGRLGVDVCAPGDNLFTTYAPKSHFATFRYNLIQGGGGLYGRASAVSAAAPIATGIIALMLQANPQLDAAAVRTILRETARLDAFTGTTPSGTWGYGKVDALAALDRVLGGSPTTLFVPVVLSSAGAGGSFFTTEMTLTNRGSSEARITYAYTQAFGDGSGTGTDTLPAGKQKVVPDAIEYLRGRGVPIPATGNRGGTLRVTFDGLSSPSAAAITLRTTTPVPPAAPTGAAGLAYAGIRPQDLLSGPVVLTGLRQSDADRSNVAVQNAGGPADGEIRLRLTAISGTGTFGASLGSVEVALPPGGFQQYRLSDLSAAATNAYVRVERISGSAPFYAYGVINDNNNSDGSLVVPVAAGSVGGTTGTTLPVVVETSVFSTEVILTNLSASPKSLRLTYVASALSGGSAAIDVSLAAGEQLVIPGFVQYLRDRGVSGVPAPGSTFVGALFVAAPAGSTSGLAVAARTGNPGGGGRYGLFYVAVPYGQAATGATYTYAMQQNANNRSNLAIVNTGETDGNAIVCQIQVFDGETGAKVAESPQTIPARGFVQINGVLGTLAPGTSSAFLRVARTSGANPFLTYGVINDGGSPGQRSGDGAFVASDLAP